ncbi:type VI secretion system tip protein TssI/VgrG [Chelativorans sp. AA-79]|uniref:type VI secretion system Vgr family protein n=1 Tax=Chelativorans sp. AA-79 TaxID=3028735 RepID=UPI0023F643CF|nr:type VI secretion system tip protein TssI/VgrG [Chelativorans sp. AA-79]WEX10878.1 type VI secretion system tip protein TssI/VgrG [Chelativorans sp. AA-79]
MSPYTQESRVGNFKTPLGTDKLVLRRFDGIEGMNELFEYHIEAITTDQTIDFGQAIGGNCSLALKTVDGGTRYFDGILTEVVLVEETTEGLVYDLTLRPWLWLLSKTRNSLIFHNQSAPEIIQQIFGKHSGLARFEALLSRSYPTLEYCVQYRESDLAFARRLMEQHGINFHFRHEEGKHTLVLGDGARAYDPIAGDTRPFIGIVKRHQRESEHFHHWAPERRFTTGRVTLNDYDFKRPSANLRSERTGDAQHRNAHLEEYDYPGKYKVESNGQDYARWRLEGIRAADGHFHAAGDCVSCTPGQLVTLTNHPNGVHNKKYLALRCVHAFRTEAYRSVSATADEPAYDGRYEFIDATRPYAPEPVTPKPYLRGPQTALVVGSGEIDCDEFGRVTVRFFWDRNNDQSMRARVAQVWASEQWGGLFTPRVGMEVIVDFLEGDPDHPIVIGCVYNGTNTPPYLPGEENISGWKSNSTPGGGGYNEFIMDDTAGDELVRLHAQRDLESTIENDERRTIGNDRTTTIGHNDTLTVGNNIMIEAGSQITLKVGGSTIVIDSTSITLKSMNVTGHATGHLETKSDATASHKASGPMEIRGLIVNVN